MLEISDLKWHDTAKIHIEAVQQVLLVKAQGGITNHETGVNYKIGFPKYFAKFV